MRNLIFSMVFLLMVTTSGYSNGISPNTSKSYFNIEWSKPFTKTGAVFVPGLVKTSFGNFSIYWKIGPDRSIQLFTLNTSSGAEVRPIETRLYLFQSDDAKYTTIFIERFPLLNQEKPPMLQKIALVKTEDLNTGLDSGLKFVGP